MLKLYMRLHITLDHEGDTFHVLPWAYPGLSVSARRSAYSVRSVGLLWSVGRPTPC